MQQTLSFWPKYRSCLLLTKYTLSSKFWSFEASETVSSTGSVWEDLDRLPSNMPDVKTTNQASAEEDKVAKLSRVPLKIGTHNGTFHCDEVLACAMLTCLPEYADATIVRTREQSILDTCDIVVDVGGEYNPEKHRYDHHQRSFKDSMNSLKNVYKWTTKLSSAGLVYLHFGHRILKEILQPISNDKLVEIIYPKVYENFIEEVDGIDNGIESHEGERKYSIRTNLSSRVKRMNLPWNATEPSNDTLFHEARSLVLEEFKDCVQSYASIWWPAREIVCEAVEKRFTVHKCGMIIELAGGCPWKDHLFEVEYEKGLDPKIYFVLFEDTNKTWRVQAVPVDPFSFKCRLPLKFDWHSLRDTELSEASGISDCVFVHSSGFIGGNKTKDGALEMALETLNKLATEDNDGSSKSLVEDAA